MSELQNHLSNLRQFGKQMKSVIQVADALENIVSLETHQSELMASVAQLEATQAQLANDAKLAASGIAAAKHEASQIVTIANQRADEITSGATAEATSIKAESQAKASEMIEAAKAEAANIKQRAVDEIAKSRAQADQLASDVHNLLAERDRLEAEIVERRMALAELKSKLAALAA